MKGFITFLWILVGIIFIQIFLGGITRLTESGLSITRWDLVSGVFPPLTSDDWHEALELYRSTPQYELINPNITLRQFKVIFFWEYLHRLWGRLSGLIVMAFLGYNLIFTRTKPNLSFRLRSLAIIVVLFGIVGAYGWLMVSSGLIDRPWVNAYYLSTHLTLAACLLAFVLYVIVLSYKRMGIFYEAKNRFSLPLFLLFLLCSAQFFLGGMLAGMRAAVLAPTYPGINGKFLPDELIRAENWSLENFVYYDENLFMSYLVHFLHRNMAILLMVSCLTVVCFALFKNMQRHNRNQYIVLGIIVILQVCLGIVTLVSSSGHVPEVLGVSHQLLGFVLLMWLWTMFLFNKYLIRIA